MTASRNAREIDVLVVGAGPAGLTAAAELARGGAGSVEVVDREQSAGGIPRHSGHTGYGLRDLHRVMTGPEYARRLVDTAVAAGATVRVGVSVTGWSVGGTLETTSRVGLETVSARAVVLATGARERPRAARLVPGARVAGIYTTGQLQQAVYLKHQDIGRRAVIVGAEHVSFSAAVTLHHAGVEVVAMTTSLARQQSYLAFRVGAAARYRFPVVTGVSVRQVLGRQRVEGIEVVHSGGKRQVIPCDTVVFTGDWIADHELARLGGLAIDAGTSGPLVDTGLRTSVAGVYGAGNLLHPVLTADAAALDGRAVAASVLADLRQPARARSGVAVVATAPLRWVAPGRITDVRVPPPRGRFVLCSSEFRTAPRIEVHQGERLVRSLRAARAMVPNRPFEIGAGWLEVIDLDGPLVTVSIR
jgi:thioredoxin reductase